MFATDPYGRMVESFEYITAMNRQIGESTTLLTSRMGKKTETSMLLASSPLVATFRE